MAENRLAKLSREYSHRGSGYVPTGKEIQDSINVGAGRVPYDVAYGETPLQGGFDIGEVGGVQLNATDFFPADLGANALAKLAMLGKSALASKGLAGLGMIGAIKPIYHGTTAEAAKAIKSRGFDLSKSADGSIWFTDNPNIGEVAASGKGGIVKSQLDTDKLKLAGWDEADKYSTDELINMGYDGIEMPDIGETTYQIFNPNKLKILKK